MYEFKLTDEMLEQEKECAKLISNLEKHIPFDSSYCYTADEQGNYIVCSFYDSHPDAGYQNDGYCHLIHCGDWFEENSTMLLWDQVKECGINDIGAYSLIYDINEIIKSRELSKINNEDYFKIINIIKQYNKDVIDNYLAIEDIKRNWKSIL